MNSDKSEYKKYSNNNLWSDQYTRVVFENELEKHKPLEINNNRTCSCPKNHINCLSAKEWLKRQLGVWEFYYEKRDIRDKSVHPAAFPISLARQVIELFTHEAELVKSSGYAFQSPVVNQLLPDSQPLHERFREQELPSPL